MTNSSHNCIVNGIKASGQDETKLYICYLEIENGLSLELYNAIRKKSTMQQQYTVTKDKVVIYIILTLGRSVSEYYTVCCKKKSM